MSVASTRTERRYAKKIAKRVEKTLTTLLKGDTL